MKKLHLCGLWSLMVSSVFYFCPMQVSASGILITRDPNATGQWSYYDGTERKAFINYENGIEKMIIAVGTENLEDKDTVWIFPVPATPEKITVTVPDGFPGLRSERLEIIPKHDYSNTIAKILLATQIYPIYSILHPVPVVSEPVPPLGKGFDYTADDFLMLDGGDAVSGGHFDKDGISLEIISAKTATGLNDYFKDKGLKVEIGSISALNNFIGKDYSFIAAWMSPSVQTNITVSDQEIKDYWSAIISDVNKDRFPKFNALKDRLMKSKYPEYGKTEKKYLYMESPEGQAVYNALMADSEVYSEVTSVLRRWDREHAFGLRGLAVTFPTQDIYFPLSSNHAYANDTLPIAIRIAGHVYPEVSPSIKKYVGIQRFSVGSIDTDNNDIWSKFQNDNEYTKIYIEAPSKSLTGDLWIKNQTPERRYLSLFVEKNPMFSLIILLVLSSVISGILAGLIFFKDLRKSPVRLGLIGLSNCFTIIGLIVATYIARTKNYDNDIKPIMDELGRKGYIWKSRLSLGLHVLAWPLLMCGAITFLLSTHLNSFVTDSGLINLIIFCIFPILAIILSDRLRKVKEEDKKLFEQLESAGYSRYLFRPKDKNKIGFIIAFSAIFMIISGYLTHLVG